MAVSFDSSKIALFRDTQFAGANDIANLDKGDKLKTHDSYYGKLGALFRSSATEARNNAVRTELLKSLGQAFGLSGMTESGGKVSFSGRDEIRYHVPPHACQVYRCTPVKA